MMQNSNLDSDLPQPDNIEFQIQLTPLAIEMLANIKDEVIGLKNNNGILEPQNYHQYPPFLQHLKNKIVDLNLFIVLIDPMQEQPPYMVADKGMHWINYNDLHNILHYMDVTCNMLYCNII